MWTSKKKKKKKKKKKERERVFKGRAKKFDYSENINVNSASYPNVQNVFFNAIQLVSLNNIKPRARDCGV